MWNTTPLGTGTSWSLDAGQSVVYEEGKSYGITADAETTDADGDKATDSASAGDLTPSVDVTIDSFEVANNGDVAASGTLTGPRVAMVRRPSPRWW
ncbi:MAG: hypothetical protein R3E57_03680 [Porticoccaceae bacterium]